MPILTASRRALFLLMACAIARVAYAQEPAPTPEPATPPDSGASVRLPIAGDVPLPRSLRGWTGHIELGLNGADGNSESFNVRGGAGATRKGEIWNAQAKFVYSRNTSGDEVTRNRFDSSLRNDFRFEKESRWRFFTQSSYEYDDFQDWQHRISLGLGLGYAFIEDDATTLIGRAGPGVTGELGREDGDDWTPELIAGVDVSHQFTDRQRIFGTFDIYPSLENFTDYRFAAKAGYEIVVDPDTGMALRLGIEDRYDSTVSGGKKRNDLEYFVLLAWNF